MTDEQYLRRRYPRCELQHETEVRPSQSGPGQAQRWVVYHDRGPGARMLGESLSSADDAWHQAAMNVQIGLISDAAAGE